MKALVILVLFSSESLACSFDTDCGIGSRCVKRNSIYGVCVGGSNPGNSYDRRPIYSPSYPEYGNTCSFNTDCGVGMLCVKGSYSIKGTCVRKRW
jgi:hypothetical protein